MYQATSTYAKNALNAADPRNQEAQLLIMAATKLQAVRDDWENRKSTLDNALIYNQKLWSAIASLVAQPENTLAIEIKQNISNLANFVFNHSLRVLADPQPQKLDIMVSINRNIALGLRGISADDEKKRAEVLQGNLKSAPAAQSMI